MSLFMTKQTRDFDTCSLDIPADGVSGRTTVIIRMTRLPSTAHCHHLLQKSYQVSNHGLGRIVGSFMMIETIETGKTQERIFRWNESTFKEDVTHIYDLFPFLWSLVEV
jgi:hypothetical protein